METLFELSPFGTAPRNEATSDLRHAKAGNDGLYVFSQIPPGTYEISVEMVGFRRSLQTGAVLRVNQTLENNISLQLGEVNQTVEVTAEVSMLDTQSANRAITLDQQKELDLPVNARNPFALVHVNAGVVSVSTGISQATQDQNHNRFSMNGGRGQAGLTLIDGVPAAAVDWGGLIASPSVDSVQEMNIARNQFDAQFGNSDGGDPRHQVVIGTTYTPTPAWVMNVLLGSGRWRENQNSPSSGMNATILGFPSSLLSQFQAETLPQFTFQGYANLNNRRYLNAARETHNAQLNVTNERGAHSLTFGWITEVARLNSTDFNTPTFAFDRGLTSGPNATAASTTTGDAIASLLLGTGSGGSAPIAAATATTAMYHGAYFQDSWRATRRLTLHLGVRWELQPGRTERFNRFNYFDFYAPSPLAQQTGLPLPQRSGLAAQRCRL